MTRVVSFQGAQLTPSERRRLEQQRRVRAFMSPHLQQQVEATLAKVDQLRAESRDDPYRYRLEYHAKGTPVVGDAFGF